jgi:hypothetical protein
VWVSPQPYKIVVARVTQNINAFGQGVGVIINEQTSTNFFVTSTKTYGRDLYDGSGNLIQPSGCDTEESDCSYDNWILTSLGQVFCPDSDIIEVVTCIELKDNQLIATKTRLQIPGVTNLGPGNSDCFINTTECDGTPPPTETPTETDNNYFWLKNCDPNASPLYLRRPEGELGSSPNYQPPDGRATKVGLYPGMCFELIGNPAYPPSPIPTDFTAINIGAWFPSTPYSSCEECLSSDDIWLKNCCAYFSPQYLLVTKYSGQYPSYGQVYRLEYPGIEGCFTVIVDGSCHDYTTIETPDTFNLQTNCEQCFTNYDIVCPPSPSGNYPLIRLVDRIGSTHFINDMVYAYYDTYRSEYIILTKQESNIQVYGEITLGAPTSEYNGILSIEGISSANSKLQIGDQIKIRNPLGFSIKKGCTARGVASRFINIPGG